MACNYYPKIVLLGDSLTERAFDKDANWAGLIHSFVLKSFRPSDVINRGVSGFNTRNLKENLSILKPDLIKDLACLTILIGTNDSCNFNQQVPLEEYKANLIEIIDHIIKSGVSKDKIVLITPPTNWFNAEKTKKYSDTMIDIGKELDITVLNSFELTNRKENFKKAFVDGCHFNSFGAELIFDLIKYEVLERVKKFYNQANNE